MPPFCEKMGFCPSTTINLVQVEPKRGAPDLTQNNQTRSSFLFPPPSPPPIHTVKESTFPFDMRPSLLLQSLRMYIRVTESNFAFSLYKGETRRDGVLVIGGEGKTDLTDEPHRARGTTMTLGKETSQGNRFSDYSGIGAKM